MQSKRQDPLRAALVGFGYAGRTFHAPLLAGTPEIDLVAIVSSRPDLVHAGFPDCAVTDFPTLLKRQDIDLVVIATPNPSHFDLAWAALEAGKHVVVDKPCTLSAAEAVRLVEFAATRHRILTVFHNRRWDSDFLTLRNVLDSGELGAIASLESRFDRYRPEVRDRWRERAGPGTGTWFDLGPHLVDQALVLFGVPDGVTGDLAMQRSGAAAPDYFHVTLRYPQHRMLLSSSYLAADPGPRFRVFGHLGSYVKHGQDLQENALARGERPASTPHWGNDPVPATLVQATSGTTVARTIDGVPGNYPAFYAAVHAAVTGSAPPPVSGAEIIAGMQIIEAAIESTRTGHEVKLRSWN